MRRMGTWIAIVAILAALASGCSVIGAVHGMRVDAARPRHEQLRGKDLVRVQPGTRVTLLLDDSTRVTGIYRGSVRVADDAYRATYEAWRAHHPRGAAFPEIGERVELHPGGKGDFHAFIAQGVAFETGLRHVAAYDGDGWLARSDGSRIDLRELRQLTLAGELPSATALRIETVQTEQRITTDHVLLLGAPTARHGARNGFIVGAIIDGGIVAGVVSGLRDIDKAAWEAAAAALSHR